MKNKNNLVIVSLIVLVLVLAGYIVYDRFFDNTKNEIVNNEIHEDDNKNGKVIYMCGTSNSDGTYVIKNKGETIDKDSVCEKGYIGKYICQNENCGFGMINQSSSGYIDYEKSIAVLFDGNENHGMGNQFLYDFKNSKKLSDDYYFSGGLVGSFNYAGDNQRSNNIDYMIVSKEYNTNDKNKSAIIRNDGVLITDFIYDSIGIGCLGGIMGDSDTIIPVMKNGKTGFLNFKTGKETTEIKYNFSSACGMDFVRFPLNTKLNLAYVSVDNSSYIIDTTNGNVKKEFNKVYNFILPLGYDLLLIDENNTFDVVDYNLKSVIDEKIAYQGEIFTEVNENFDKITICINPYSETNSITYEFDLNTKKLTKTSD